MKVIFFFIGFIAGMLLMAWACRKDRLELLHQHDEAMRLAKSELDDAEDRIIELHEELAEKQRVIDSQNRRINKQRRIIETKGYDTSGDID